MFVFSENLACSVFMKHPFLDLPFCLITDNLSLTNWSLTSVLLSVFYWLTLNCRRKTKLALGTVQTVLTQIFISWLMSSSIYTNTCIWSLSRPCTFPFSSDSARTLQKEWRKKHLIHVHQDKLARINFKSKHSSAINPVQH